MEQRKLFGTDGIRGVANRGSMTPEIAFRIGAAMTYLGRRAKHPPRIVVGKDTRLSGYMFETSIAAGVCAMGGRVMLSGPLPTPAIAHLTTSMRADAGVVISASHNPFDDNGIKLFGPDGFKLPDETELQIERLVLDGSELDRRRPTGMRVGSALRLDDAPGRYVAYVKSTFPSDMTLDGVRVVVDAAHGAAYRTAPLVFSELGADVHALGVKPNGKNINDRCGALHPEACARDVRRRKAHCGVALDGDADRVIIIDEQGDIVDGDAVMALCATRMLRNKRLRRKTVVATVMSNLGLERALARDGGKLIRCQVGDRYVVETMRKDGFNFGGEQSGHLIFLDHATTGDGLVAALQVLAIVLREQRPLSELAAEAMQRVPQVLVNVKLPDRRDLDAMPRTQRAMKDAEKKLGKDGRVLVRWSGTEPKLRVMVEGPRQDHIEALANAIAAEARHDLA